MGTAGYPATIPQSHRSRVPGEALKLAYRGEALVRAQALIAYLRLEFRPLGSVLLHGAHAFRFAID